MTAQPLIGGDIFYFTSTTSFEISRVAIMCFPVGSEEVLLVHPRWPPWPLIGRNIFDFFPEKLHTMSPDIPEMFLQGI